MVVVEVALSETVHRCSFATHIQLVCCLNKNRFLPCISEKDAFVFVKIIPEFNKTLAVEAVSTTTQESCCMFVSNFHNSLPPPPRPPPLSPLSCALVLGPYVHKTTHKET